MKQGSTFILRSAIISLGLVVLAFCIFVLPIGIREENLYHPIFFGMYVTAVPFFIALYQALKLLGYIDHNKAFSYLAIHALKNIKYCALVISGLFIAGMPFIYHVADKDDAPGAIVLGLIIMFASFVVATFAALLQKLLQNAMDIKAENDLTV